MDQLAQEGITRRIVASIKAQIHDGAYGPGDRLPSTRALAAEWGVSRTTVTAAYGQLIAEGYLETHQGARAIVAAGIRDPAPQAPAAAAAPPRLSAFGRRILDLPAGTGEEPGRIADFRYGDLSAADFPALAWRRAIGAASLRRSGRLRYGEPQGASALRLALQGYLWRARGIRCGPDQIVVVNGSQQGLDLCARLLLDPGDRFVIENPGYALARRALLAAGGEAVPTPVDGEGMRVDALPDARLAYVTPSHQFPLGSVLSASRRRALLAWAARTGATVIEDDYDGEYRYDIAPIPPLQTLGPEQVIYVGTVSKTLSPTLRLGYLVVPEAFCRPFAEAKRLTDRHTSLPEQEALADLLASGAYERHVRTTRRRNGERRAALLAALAADCAGAVTVAGAEAGLHLVAWLDRVAAGREGAVIAAARAAGVGTYPIAPLYDPAGPRPPMAGLVLGYAGLDAGAIRRGVQVLGQMLAGFPAP
ncbi:MocR-like pyridoxine biosynthesis transcription factor PdxR [Methylobacterium sp. ID0610]|uniref:MocR-like pyridoxine biosynthesis transcription factor PdxR n=1 Tax=Methylobacterium carpenticola TaxID=3344827 RepID=UPI0036A4E945